ncbi:hypothetical protein [Plantactinospora veratri]
MTLRQVRRRCEQLARGIRVPDPFDLDTFIGDFGADRGRPVHLIAFDLPPGAPCGLCVSTDAADYLVVTSAATGVQRVHIALHELAHLLLEHRLHLLDDVRGSRQLFRHLDRGWSGRCSPGPTTAARRSRRRRPSPRCSDSGPGCGGRRHRVPRVTRWSSGSASHWSTRVVPDGR